MLFRHLANQFLLTVFASDLLKIVENCQYIALIGYKSLKTAVFKPILMKRSLDPSVFNNYRPISNLPFIEKNIDKIIALRHH